METEKRLIDANEFSTRLSNVVYDIFTYPDRPYDYARVGYFTETIQTVLEETKTVDAAEVVHGRWVNPYINRYGHPCHCCSVCGFKASYQDKNYCPNCGAKMDGNGNG